MKRNLLLALAAVVFFTGCATTPRRDEYLYPHDYRDDRTGRPMYVRPAPVTTVTTQSDDYNRTVIKQGLMGAAVGAIAAETSGGNAGTGALVGAGTNVIGGALINTLTAPSQPQTQYVVANQGYLNPAPPAERRIVRKFDSAGNIISEEETLL